MTLPIMPIIGTHKDWFD